MLLSFVPLKVGGCKQFTSCKRSGNLLGKLESNQRRFNWNIPFKCRKPWIDFFSREYQKSGKAEYKGRQNFGFGGTRSGNARGISWSLITTLRMWAFFLMTLSWVGFLTLASGTGGLLNLDIHFCEESIWFWIWITSHTKEPWLKAYGFLKLILSSKLHVIIIAG